jgi:excisionase family DNA binding protein
MITMDDVAELLSISRTQVRRLIETDELPHYRIGKAYRFDPKDIELWKSRRMIVKTDPRRLTK